jgi:hypothetical protein
MKAAEDDDVVALDDIQENVGESANHSLSNLTVNPRKAVGEAENRGHGTIDRPYELSSEARSSSFVPGLSVEDVEPGLGSESDLHSA